MLPHNGKSKFATAVIGIALTLLPCLQQTHLLCQIAGCGNRATDQSVLGQDACIGHGDHCCDNNSQTPAGLPVHEGESDDNLPCGPECFFAQPVAPCEAPRDSASSFSTKLTITWNSGALSTSIYFHQIDDVGGVANDVSCINSSVTCARLCRFLI